MTIIYLSQFQCSSASRKFLNRPSAPNSTLCCSVSVLFSEPKIPQPHHSNRALARHRKFQCSSASRKFLNGTRDLFNSPGTNQFQCSSASRKFLNAGGVGQYRHQTVVSVLFSEPKIPQPALVIMAMRHQWRFSALQRAENSSTRWRCPVYGLGD